MKTLRLGTRGSALATTQSAWVAERLRELHPGLAVELVTIVTSGDKFSAAIDRGESTPLPEGGAPNVKAMFVKEIESALLDGSIDLAVHSSKDLPVELPAGLILGAFPQREEPWDVFIGRAGVRYLKDLPLGSVVGTASLRRQIQLAQYRPDLKFAPIRGNVDTRLRKLEEGAADGIILAAAGLRRLGRGDQPHEILTCETLVPAPGQGALALEVCAERAEVRDIIAKIDDEATRLEVEVERKFMRDMGGGCATPLGALARSRPDGVEFTVFWSEEDGSGAMRLSGRSGKRPEELASLAEGLRIRIREGS
ncbi:MAG: hydroxymethylbilane synthase [Elusimicrobiota bacterium]